MGDLIKIRDISNKYDVSARTLRYYEDMGLLSSIRSEEYAYRMYDDQAIIKLEQILILRKLNISIKDIQFIFNAPGSEAVLKVLGKKVTDIDDEVALLHELKGFIMEFIRQIEHADFNEDANIKKLYAQAKAFETQLTDAANNTNPTIDANRLVEVTQQTNHNVSNVMVVKLPTFRAASEGWATMDEAFWHWSHTHRHLFKEIVWGNSEFFVSQGSDCISTAAVQALKDYVTAADTAPYEVITVEGGLYASTICVDMDDESITGAQARILKWLEGTRFVRDDSRRFLTHKLFPHDDVRRGLGYHQLVGYMPIAFDTDGWQLIYTLATDPIIQGIEQGATWQGFPRGVIGCTGSSNYTFCEVNDRNGILLTNRSNDWDGVNIYFAKLNIPPNHHCTITVRGHIADDMTRFPKGSIELTCLPGYENMAYHAVVDGAAFTLSHTLSITPDRPIPEAARISTGRAARKMSFAIEHIEVAIKPYEAELNYIEAARPMQDVVDMAAFEIVYDGTFYAKVNGETPPPQTVIKAPEGKYMRVKPPQSCTDIAAFVAEVRERYLPDWFYVGSGIVLTGEVELMKDGVLLLSITQDEYLES